MNKPALSFSQQAVASYERTFTKLFEQSFEEAARLERLNEILSAAEESLMSEDIATLPVPQRLMMIDILVKSKVASSTGLIAYSEVLKEIKNVVGLMESMHAATALPGQFAIEDDSDVAALPGL